MDFLSPAGRSRRMSLIRKANTKPELIVRSIAHRLGFRFRLHRSDLPGSPDLVFPRLKKVIEVRGCFWHSHSCRRRKRPVSSRTDYWRPKLERNVARDRANLRLLRMAGWDVLVVWECQLRNLVSLANQVERFLRIQKPFLSGLASSHGLDQRRLRSFGEKSRGSKIEGAGKLSPFASHGDIPIKISHPSPTNHRASNSKKPSVRRK